MQNKTKIDPLSLRDIPEDIEATGNLIKELENKLSPSLSPLEKVSILGELGHHLRTIHNLEKAEKTLLEALRIIQEHSLGLKKEIQQKIRLAHVYQWQSNFQKSNPLFEEIIGTCRKNTEATYFLPFALQHSGKNLFDQHRYHEALQQFEEALQIRILTNAPQDQIDSTEKAIQATKHWLSK